MNVELLPLCRDSKEEDEAVKPHVDYLWRHVGNQVHLIVYSSLCFLLLYSVRFISESSSNSVF